MKTNINWYPGHMLKAKKEIIAILKSIDLVLEVVDARLPYHSHNEMLDSITKNKPKLMIFNKADLANETAVQKVVREYEKKGYQAIITNSHDMVNRNKLMTKINQSLKFSQEKYEKKGYKKEFNIIIVGMPNVGKSTIINALGKNKKVEVGNKPGITKKQKWIEIEEGINLLDTPGILIPKIETEDIGCKMVLCQLIKDDVVEIENVAFYFLKYLLKHNVKALNETYKLNFNKNTTDYEEIYNQIGNKTGALVKGGVVDYEKVSRKIIQDYRNLKFGKITFLKD